MAISQASISTNKWWITQSSYWNMGASPMNLITTFYLKDYLEKSSPWLLSWQSSLIFSSTPIDLGSVITPCTIKLFQVIHKSGYWTTYFYLPNRIRRSDETNTRFTNIVSNQAKLLQNATLMWMIKTTNKVIVFKCSIIYYRSVWLVFVEDIVKIFLNLTLYVCLHLVKHVYCITAKANKILQWRHVSHCVSNNHQLHCLFNTFFMMITSMRTVMGKAFPCHDIILKVKPYK